MLQPSDELAKVKTSSSFIKVFTINYTARLARWRVLRSRIKQTNNIKQFTTIHQLQNDEYGAFACENLEKANDAIVFDQLHDGDLKSDQELATSNKRRNFQIPLS
jgi:hypothetical protein